MNAEIRNLEPKVIWNHFADLNAVPRASKKEERVIAFMKSFGESLGLETSVDEVGNVLIKKPATADMEGRKTIVLQSHLDMVHQKNADTVFDFDTQGIEMYVDEDWVKARGTTLGADNGLGVAAIMSILESKELPHPALEALFTIDEETGMTGALGLKGGVLTGEILLNLDTEEDDEIGIGCAGGIDVTARRAYELSIPEGDSAIKISITGLNGGHSGGDIHLYRGNANKIMARLLHKAYENYSVQIAEMHGGSLRNAIPRECFATVVLPSDKLDALKEDILAKARDIKMEFSIVDPELSIELEGTTMPEQVMCPEAQKQVVASIYAAHNGVYRMSPAIQDLVEASNNVAKVTIDNGTVEVLCLTRSSVESSKYDLVNTLTSTFELAGAEVTTSGSYPGWSPNMEASILKVMEEQYETLFGEKPNVAACHAGLECGILGQNYPGMEMISFGPTIRGAHSPDERACISSTQKFWHFLKEILKNAPVKE